MVLSRTEEKASYALSLIGGGVADEIIRISSKRRSGLSGIREISVRSEGRCSVVIEEERIALLRSPSRGEMDDIVTRICDGALYAHRDSIASGYVSLKGGIRVGVGGYAKYEYKSFVGVSDIRSLLFRIPGHICEFEDELVSVFSEGVGSGMLIYSPPGVGKTTALRALAKRLGGGVNPRRVAVIDERCEFDEEDYRSGEVDILKGYRRKKGIEIATRTMSPDVIIIDEIGADDAEGIAAVSRCGIPLIASAHAGGFDELMSRGSLYSLIGMGTFGTFVGITRRAGGYSLTVDRR